MPTTTKLTDFAGRFLNNANPGTTLAKDYMGRAVVAGNKDYLGRALALDNPSNWAATTAVTAGQYRRRTTGSTILKAKTSGTTGGSEPAAPSKVGGTVVDGGVTWVRVA